MINNKITFGIKDYKAIISKDFDLDLLGFKNLANYKNDFDLSHIPPLERRRLNNASKCAFSLTKDKQIDSNMFIIFSSFYGEINNCFKMLLGLRDDFLVSPTAFSISVLNATPAMLAIAQSNQNEITAISANPSLEYGILNAYTKLNDYRHSLDIEQKDSKKQDFSYPDEALILSYYEKLDFHQTNLNKSYMLLLHLTLNHSDENKLNCALGFSPAKNKNDLILSDLHFLSHLSNASKKYSIESQMKWQWEIQSNEK